MPDPKTYPPINYRRKDQARFEFYIDNLWHVALAVRKEIWLEIVSGSSVVVEGDLVFNDENYEALWEFNSGLDGKLRVWYFREGASRNEWRLGFEGQPSSLLKFSLPIEKDNFNEQ